MDGKTDTTMKACPFCGEAATLEGCGYEGVADCYSVYVECISCGAQGGSELIDKSDAGSRTEAEAVADAIGAWNRRKRMQKSA